ncbi:TPA: hypothetical protein DDZ49_01530 [Candidatus Wolfebacteria bacterium]|nr:hypothetical protein [Candidatus Wolfebacteria bacterium]HBN86840.1 hypothetical protein [Candidatus Wolfebacteria bacterium]HCM52512.1 hypothetical protein [Candidatus Wolfebacteria bacterium]
MSKIKSLFQVLILVALIGTASSALPINSAMAEADTTAPTISAISFANKTGTVTDSGIALNLFEATDADLATAGSITVSEAATLQITSQPLPSIELVAGANVLTTAGLFGYNILATELGQTLAGGSLTVSGTLTDTSNNVTNVMITIMATAPADTTAPTISLLGSNPIDMTVGGTYTDAGATSSDNIDGDITARIVTTSTVNTTVAGTYLVTYVVSDLAGNGATSTRTVNVAAPAPVVVVSGGGGGGSYTYYGSYGQPVVTTAPAVVSTVVETPVTVVNAAKPAITEKPAGQVLGVETFAFSENLTIGSTGNTVTELQNVLAKEGFFNLSATGYFGQVTKNAVIAYQKAHNINPASGFVGSLTRAELNKVQGGQVLGVSTASGDALRAQIATLQTQLLEIMKQLVEQLKAKQ